MEQPPNNVVFGRGRGDQRPATPPDALFYTTLRQTIQGLDNLTLQTTLIGSTFMVGFLGLAGVLYKSETFLTIGNFRLDVGRYAAVVIAGGACVSSLALLIRLNMYLSFLGKAVKIAMSVETLLLPAELQLTHQFDEVRFAGIRGKWLFSVLLSGIFVVCAAATAFFLIAAVFPAAAPVVPPAAMGR